MCLLSRVSMLLLTLLPCSALAGDNQIDVVLASRYFQEAERLCLRDNGELWGKSLCVPMALIHPVSREVVTNQQDSSGSLVKKGNVYSGIWPDQLGVANSTATWGGIKWTTLVWPLPSDSIARAALMLHESFHNVQEGLGFPSRIPANPQLDTRDGRVWLRLEWNALRKALTHTSDNERKEAVRDALIFRNFRHVLFPESDETERQVEMHEGLAEYTGLKLCGLPPHQSAEYLATTMYGIRSMARSYVSSFAYWSGPAYAFLLDDSSPAWRKGLTADRELAVMLKAALSIELPEDLERTARDRMTLYEGSDVLAQETEREQVHLRRVNEYTERLVKGHVLVLPFVNMNMQYDPRDMVSLDSLGTVYPSIRVSDDWGIITVTEGGALMSPNWSSLTVAAPQDSQSRPIRGDGWGLELSPNWKIVPGRRPGDLTLEIIE